MARQKEFDRDEVLQKAMEVFWSRGYEAASIQDLVRHMGINRQSLYDTFGDKHALYLQSLDRYREVESRKIFVLVERAGSVKRGLRHLFQCVVDGSCSDEHRRGCFMGNATSELAGRCKATAARACSNMAAAEEALYRTLMRGKRDGEIKGIRDLRAVARFLFSSLQGLQLMAKATQDRKILEDVVKVTLSVLD
ncbi:MAG: TetR/AcrR family transcriptional regulator, transcriptional repressor for nem operon [Acidobacteriota bacterium]|jgi:TetR/AcrR family transcriptional repressor of nem operon|nr:TetR/AcrR family transcriptional regulator, transcriptional repressor for nem operon [Acidobacteriota bacterium]